MWGLCGESRAHSWARPDGVRSATMWFAGSLWSGTVAPVGNVEEKCWWHEAKGGTAKLTRSQQRFRCLMRRNHGLPVVVGGPDAARAHLEEIGVLHETAATGDPTLRLRLPRPPASETCR